MKGRNKFKWYIPDDGETIEDAIEIETIWDADTLSYIGEDVAENYFHHNDGWEASWPVTFAITDMDNKELGTVEVYCESQPCFTSGKVSKP